MRHELPLYFAPFGHGGHPDPPPGVHTHSENMTVHGVEPGVEIRATLRVDLDDFVYHAERDLDFPQIWPSGGRTRDQSVVRRGSVRFKIS